jgi:uncharacterized SAM-binding protein YcdF (DUF218 family)
MTSAKRPTERPSPLWHRVGVGAAVGGFAGFLLRDLLPFELASAWVPLALAGAMLWPTRLHRVMAVLTVCVAGLWVAVAFTPLAARLAPLLVRQQAPTAAEAVFVLSHRLQTDREPTAASQARLLHGLELLRQGFAPWLILSDQPPRTTYADVARGEMSRLGLSGGEVVSLRGHARSTHEEAVRVGALCRERGWRRLLVVTSPLHSRRACAAVEREGLEVVCSPAVETEYDVETLDRPVERLAAFRQTVRETLALWFYWSRGWLTVPPAGSASGRGASPGTREARAIRWPREA